MSRRAVLFILVLIFATSIASVGAQEADLDPLLQLLVEQGVITMEQALAVQAEYDRRSVAEQAPAVAPPQSVEMTPPEPPVQAAAEPDTEAKSEKWYDRIDFKGDLRLRGEFFFVDGISNNDRRERYRARIRPGISTDITDWMSVGLQLRSGDPLDPVSDNSSLDGGFSLIPINISEGYAAFDIAKFFDLTIGKFDPKKKWTATDFQWDDDVTVEGSMQEWSVSALKASTYQFVLEESGSSADSYIFGAQAEATIKTDSTGTFTFGAGYDDWQNPQKVADLTLNGKLHGNRVTNLLDENDQLISDFNIANAFVTWSGAINENWPVKFHLFGYYNTGAQGLGKDYNKGYFVRLQFGDYKKPYQIAFRASRYYSEPDALFYVFAQSDTTMASDVDGYRLDFRMGFVKKSFFNVTWYHTKPVYSIFPTMDRLQVDYIIVF